MVRQEVLKALARAAAAGLEATAYAELRQIDPVLRPIVRFRLRRALRRAWLTTRAAGDVAHALRLAWLLEAGRIPLDGDDIEAVQSLYEQVRTGAVEPPASRWWPTIAVSALAAAAVGFAVLWPSNRGPLETPVGLALGRGLPRCLSAIDEWARALDDDQERLASLRETADQTCARVLSPEVVAELGPEGAARLEEVVALARHVMSGIEVERTMDASERVERAVRDLNRALERAGQPYFLDGDVVRGRRARPLVIYYVFHVLRRSAVSVDHEQVRTLHVRRLDNLNWEGDYLGYTRETMDVALVLHDAIDEVLVAHVAPALAPDEPMPLVDLESRDLDAPWQDALQRRAGELARRELGEVVADEAAQELGALLARRSRRFIELAIRLRKQDVRINSPRTLHLEDGWDRSLQGYLAPSEVQELREIDEALQHDRRLSAFGRLRDAAVASVERHEVQHRIDYARPAGLPLPECVRSMFGVEPGEPLSWAAERVSRETSAYLAQIAHTRTPFVDLTALSRFLFDKGHWGSVYADTALIVFEGLGESLGIDVGGELVYRGQVLRERLAELYLHLTELPPEELQAAAEGLWEKWYEARLPDLRPAAAVAAQ